MEIKKNRENEKLTIALVGRLDTATAPELDKTLDAELDGVTELVFDLEKLEYTSSAGLRVFLKTQKRMMKVGSMTLINVSSDIMDIFDITGFTDILNFA